MNATSEGHREQLLEGLRRFVVSARQIGGVRRIAVLGSIVTTKPDPKDIDVLVAVADDADLTPLATCSRRLPQNEQRRFSRSSPNMGMDGHSFGLRTPAYEPVHRLVGRWNSNGG